MSEPTYKALEELRARLAERDGVILDGSIREIDGEPWILCSPELMLSLIDRAAAAEAALGEAIAPEILELFYRIPPAQRSAARWTITDPQAVARLREILEAGT